jgi:2-phosphosulfolactate phosphatase
VTADGALLVVVDVLSFTTSVSVAAERGTAVIPAPWRDGRSEELAATHQAELAVGRREVTTGRPWSLSPAALRRAPAPARLVLPSPNGATIVASAQARGTVVVAGCLRNATAVGRWLAQHAPGPVAVVAAGERWPDGSLRPALDDLVGAGAVLEAFAGAMVGRLLSPEASAAISTWAGGARAEELLASCASGRELAGAGFAEDVVVAGEVDVSSVVPLLRDGVFLDAS